MNRLKFFAVLALLLSTLHTAGLPGRAAAQFLVNKIKPVTDLADIPFNRPEPKYKWEPEKNTFFPTLLGLTGPYARTIRTKYFAIYFTSAEHTARRIAEIGDEVFEEISKHYPTSIDRFAPVHVYVDDSVDYLGNAYSAYWYNFIVFWSTPAAFDTRGTKDWIRDVFTHELTHHITLKAAHTSLPFMFGIISTSRSNQNPDFIFSFPIYHMAVPNWFSEGIAQYESRKNGGDFWDTHRDMLLRMATLEDDRHSYTNMGYLRGKDSFHAEMVYNQGFALLNYVEETYGEAAVRAMVEKQPIVNFKSAVKKSLGISANQLYREWSEHLNATYGALADSIRAAGEREGERIYDGGSMEYHPVYSPDGTKMAFLSNDGSDYNSLTKLMVMDLATRKVKKVAQGRKYGKYADNRFSWTPDGGKLVYNKTPGGRWDIFTYDLNTKKERRFTVGLRGRDPAVSPDGKQIAYVYNRDGTNSLGLVNIDGTNRRFLTHHNDGTQYYGPRWSPDGKKILFSVFRGEDRDIAVINADAATLRAKATKNIRPKSDKIKKSKQSTADSARTASDSTGAVSDSIRIAQRQKALEDSLKAFPDSLAYANNAGFEALIRSGADERDPVWLPDGSGILFSSNQTGIFNLYTHDLTTGRQEQITNVIGGAFAPSVSPDGKDILYAGYHHANYSIYRIGRSAAVAVAAVDTLSRDYGSIYTGEDLSKLYNTGRYSTRLTSYGVLPILVLGPTFVGNRFGLNQASFGAQMAWGDMLGSDTFVTGLTLGKNLKRRTDLNSDLFVSYQKSLGSVNTELKSYRPQLFIGTSRQTINSLIDRGVIATQRDTTSGTLITVIDSQQVIIPRTTQHTNLSLTEEDDYKHLFTDFSVGVDIGVGRNQSVTLSFGHRRYSENLHLTRVLQDSTRYLQADAETGALKDITDQIPGTGEDRVVMDDFLYRDLTFFKSNNLGIVWRYYTFKPAKDNYLNPTGGRAITLRYRRINATITDSLALSQDLNQDNIPDPTDTDPSPTIYRADNAKLGINEYIASWNEFIALPGRTTLALQAFMGYKDKPIKRVQLDGGTFEGAFYYPLRYYLGGFGTLRGYPYFSISGGKAFFGRASFTFPIFQKVDKELPPFFFDKIYGTLFVETGAAGDFKSLRTLLDSDNKFKRSAFLTDWGLELRMQMFSNYAFPIFGYFQIAFPTRKVIPDRTDPTLPISVDDRRIYFGFSI